MPHHRGVASTVEGFDADLDSAAFAASGVGCPSGWTGVVLTLRVPTRAPSTLATSARSPRARSPGGSRTRVLGLTLRGRRRPRRSRGRVHEPAATTASGPSRRIPRASPTPDSSVLNRTGWTLVKRLMTRRSWVQIPPPPPSNQAEARSGGLRWLPRRVRWLGYVERTMKHRAGCLMGDVVGDAAQESALALHALVPDNDEVGIHFLGDAEDRLGGVAGSAWVVNFFESTAGTIASMARCASARPGVSLPSIGPLSLG